MSVGGGINLDVEVDIDFGGDQSGGDESGGDQSSPTIVETKCISLYEAAETYSTGERFTVTKRRCSALGNSVQEMTPTPSS